MNLWQELDQLTDQVKTGRQVLVLPCPRDHFQCLLPREENRTHTKFNSNQAARSLQLARAHDPWAHRDTRVSDFPNGVVSSLQYAFPNQGYTVVIRFD